MNEQLAAVRCPVIQMSPGLLSWAFNVSHETLGPIRDKSHFQTHRTGNGVPLPCRIKRTLVR